MPKRCDVVLRVLDGPLASQDEQILRGPVVHLGDAPGPGGLRMQGYRGLADRHATITAYAGQAPTLAPVGGQPVRIAPHTQVDWGRIEPLRGPRRLSRGCAIHLGPPRHGATLQFTGVRQLGARQRGGLASGDGASGPLSVRTIRPHGVPAWFLGCSLLMAAVFVTVPLAVVFITSRPIEPLGPVVEGQSFYEFARAESVHPELREGLDQPLYDFVMAHNVAASGRDRLRRPDHWDRRFEDLVARSMQTHLKSWSVFRRLDAVRDDYATVLEAMRDASLPDVFAGIPYRESRYRARAQSAACAKGYWQFMPEMALRIDRTSPLRFRVARCRFKDADLVWEPTRTTPPRNAMKNADYVDQSPDLDPMDPARCRIDRCAVDDRTDLARSTAAAIFALREPWKDPDLRTSGALVQIAVASHNAGYDDQRFGQYKPTNLRPAFLAWREGVRRAEWPRFYGANITTDNPHEDRNGSVLPAQTQHYVYSIVAAHFLAVCYYGQNYAHLPAFRTYARYTGSDGYCSSLEIPIAETVRRRGTRSAR